MALDYVDFAISTSNGHLIVDIINPHYCDPHWYRFKFKSSHDFSPISF